LLYFVFTALQYALKNYFTGKNCHMPVGDGSPGLAIASHMYSCCTQLKKIFRAVLSGRKLPYYTVHKMLKPSKWRMTTVAT